MKAFVRERYGAPDVLKLVDVPMPAIGRDGVLVRIRASSLNQADLDYLYGRPFLTRLGTGLRRPRNRVFGLDVAVEVEAVGVSVTDFRPGDEVFGDLTQFGFGAFAEYAAGASLGAQAGWNDLRESSDGPAVGNPGTAGAPGRGTHQAGTPGARERSLGQRWSLRRADREGLRCRGDRRV